ncbi:MAG: glycosyltransferase family 4 protein [Verrucomicrobiota bacterium JB022]|nr:glycosyltransferase family 4 protein [Verrucomicrobiota bacterium JB022]
MSLDHIIVITDTGVVNGGLAYVAVESALGLARQGHRVTFISGTEAVDPRLEEASGLEVVKLGREAFLDRPDRKQAAIDGIHDREVQRRLEALLQSRPKEGTVVHLHGWVKVFSPSAISAIEHAGLPWIFTAHDYFGACPNGAFYQYPAQKICTLSPLGARCLTTNCDSRSYPMKLWRSVRSFSQAHILGKARHLRAIVYPSDFTRKVLAPHLPKVAAEVPTSPMRIEQRPLAPWSEDGPIVFAGRISPEKGCHLLAEAGRLLGRSVTLIGDGPALAELQERYPEHSFLGWQPQSFVWDFLPTAGCLVFPSVWYETAGLTALEAMALGCPVIVPNGIATTEYVQDGVTGTIFERGDAASLAEAIKKTLPRGEELRRTAYSRYWAAPWTVERHCRELIRIYGQALVD